MAGKKQTPPTNTNEPPLDDGNEEDPDSGDPEGEPEGGPSEGNGGDEALKKQIESLTEMVKQQQEIITKFQAIGDPPQQPKSDAERIAELEATLKVLTQKIETDAKAKAEAERKKKEAVIEALVKEIPEFKDQKESLLKVDPTILELLSKQKAPETNSPILRVGASQGTDWNKKIAAASERRKQRTEALNAVKY